MEGTPAKNGSAIGNYFGSVFKNVFQYIRTYIKEEFDWKYFVFTLLFMAVGIYIYYYTPYLQDFRSRNSWKPNLFYYFAGLYGSALVIAYSAYAIISKKTSFLKDGNFWFLIFFAVLVFSVRSIVHIPGLKLQSLFVNTTYPTYWLRISFMLLRMFVVMIPIAFYWIYMDRREKPLYGFTLKGYDTRPYLLMLAFMVPLIVIASFQADFLSSYPRAGKWGLEYFSLDNSAHYKYYGLFELLYGLDFITIEFFFRGFLILAFMRIVGPGAILAMACFYCFIHFGKPMGETISSFWGGTLLGILAYYSGSIVGGIIVHMGIAWLMEIGAIMGKFVNN
jgi:hypothetical protein